MMTPTKAIGLGLAIGFLLLFGCEQQAAPSGSGGAERQTSNDQPAADSNDARDSSEGAPDNGDDEMSLSIQTSAFNEGQAIPPKYTAAGDDVSPPLSWSGAPEGTQAFALICDDPDAPREDPWVHWVLYNIPAGTTSLPEGVPTDERLSTPSGAMQGTNSWGNIGYGGPEPPPGHGVHHYHFKLYALDADLDYEPGLAKQQLLDKIQSHTLAEVELIGTYER